MPGTRMDSQTRQKLQAVLARMPFRARSALLAYLQASRIRFRSLPVPGDRFSRPLHRHQNRSDT